MLRVMDRLNPQTLRILALLIVLGAVLLFLASVAPNDRNGRLFNRVSSSVAIMALIATAQTLVIITRNIDLSTGSTVGLVAFATGRLISNNPDLGPLLLVLYAMALGAMFGAINGLLVAFAKVPSIIVTLCAMALFRSALVERSDSKSISTANLPEWLISFPKTVLWQWGQMQFRASFVAVVIVVHVALSRLRAARRLHAIGSNPEAAQMAGINTRLSVFVAFVLAGVRAGLGRGQGHYLRRVRHGHRRPDRGHPRGPDRQQPSGLANRR